MKKYHFVPALGAALLLSLASCSASRENLAYMSTNTPKEQQQVIGTTNWQIKVEPDDELAISVTSEDLVATAEYNLPLVNQAKTAEITQNEITIGRLQTFIVDKQGNIKFPKLGEIHVEGLTTAQIADELTRRISETVEAPYVRVQLVNAKVNVLGEVATPGIIPFTTERFSIFDALGSAGDLTIFGRRDNVTLIREVDGKVTYNRINLNDADIVNSPYYYLKQNDAIYVEPTEARKGQAEYNQNNAYKISVVSAIVSGASVIASLIIALCVK